MPITVAPEPAMTSPGRWAGSGLSRRRAVEETGRQAAYCKNIQPKALPTDLHVQHIIHTNTYLAYIEGAVQWADFTWPGLTIDCHTSLCFYGHPRQYRVQSTYRRCQGPSSRSRESTQMVLPVQLSVNAVNIRP